MMNEYILPTMKEVNESAIRELFTVISTFAGGGGSSTGYKMAGGKVLAINECDPKAIETYLANYPETPILTKPIQEITGFDLMNIAKIKQGELDIFDGSPPCTNFSIAGKREKGWGKEKEHAGVIQQNTEDLFFEYIRVLKDIQPKIFIAENVKGLIQGNAKGYFNEIMKQLKESGYIVKCALLNAAWLGVPQSRERTIIIGIRQDLWDNKYEKLLYPKPFKDQITIRNAFYQLKNDLSNIPKLNQEFEKWVNITIPGKAVSEKHPDDKYFNSKKCHWAKPSLTLCKMVHSATGNLHPQEIRLLSIPEIKRIGSFPDDFQLKGKFQDQWARIGNSVPPLMMKAIAENLYNNVIKDINESDGLTYQEVKDVN